MHERRSEPSSPEPKLADDDSIPAVALRSFVFCVLCIVFFFFSKAYCLFKLGLMKSYSNKKKTKQTNV